MRFFPMVCAAVLAVPVLSAAQAADPVADWPLTPGLRVRVLSPALGGRPETGNVVSATADTLVSWSRALREEHRIKSLTRAQKEALLVLIARPKRRRP